MEIYKSRAIVNVIPDYLNCAITIVDYNRSVRKVQYLTRHAIRCIKISDIVRLALMLAIEILKAMELLLNLINYIEGVLFYYTPKQIVNNQKLLLERN